MTRLLVREEDATEEANRLVLLPLCEGGRVLAVEPLAWLL
jgi:hypothetical protein